MSDARLCCGEPRGLDADPLTVLADDPRAPFARPWLPTTAPIRPSSPAWRNHWVITDPARLNRVAHPPCPVRPSSGNAALVWLGGNRPGWIPRERFMTRNFYDQASRYAGKLNPPGFFRWALRMPAVGFHRWLDTRRLPFPGETDRICDTVAHLEDPADPGVAWAVPVEFAIAPRAELFGRLLVYLGQLWEEERPTAERGSRYQVGAIVVNLTGRGHTSRDMRLGATGMRTCLAVVERNLEEEDAAAVLAGIAAGTIASCLLPFIPLMQGGAEAAIMAEWLRLAALETDARLRGDYGGLAVVLAEAAGRRDVWKQALRGWNVIQSQQVLEWMAEGEVKGEVKGKVGTLLEVLGLKFGPISADLASAIRATADLATLSRWVAVAVSADTLDTFRQNTQL